MRDLLVLAIVIPAAILALRRPWVGVLLWTWLSIMNPHRYSWGIAYEAPLAAITAGCTVLGLLITKDKQSPFQGTPVTIFVLFALWMTLSWLAGLDTEGDYPQWSKVMKIYFMTLVAISLLKTKNQIIAFAWVTAGSLAILGSKGGIFTVLSGGGYRVWGPPESFIYDNNHFALALVMTIPLLYMLQQGLEKNWHKLAVALAMLLCAASALGSHSRGGLLAIIAMSLMFWWRSEKKAGLGVGILIAVAVLLPFMPEEWWTRMNTIQTYDEDKSAIGRLNGWHVATQVAINNFFGGGMSYQHPLYFNMYGLYNTDTIAAHSIYFQILGNHGFVGLFLFLALWISTYRWAGWLRKNTPTTPEANWARILGSMVQVSLIGYAVGGAFLSLAYFDLPYNMMVMVVLARKWVENRAWETEPKQSLLDAVGLRKHAPPQVSVSTKNLHRVQKG